MEEEGPGDRNGSFASLKFKGDRFQGANLPLDYLGNIASYMRILRELAVEIWRERNPDRARLPSGFRGKISLSFKNVEDGSARAAIKRDSYVNDGLNFGESEIDYLTLAQTRFLRVAQAANEDRPIDELPHSLRRDLRDLIAAVGPEESLEITSLTGKDSQSPKTEYLPVTRDRMISAVRVPGKKYIEGFGIVTGIDDTSERIKVISEYGVFSVLIGRDEIRSKYRFSLNRLVNFKVDVRTNINGRIDSVDAIHSIDLVAETDEYKRLMTRLDHLAKLEIGWRDGHGRAISKKVIHVARDLASYISAIFPRISAFPTERGGVDFEFSLGQIEATLRVREDVITVEAFDDSDADLKAQAFFAITPRLLTILSDLEALVK